MQSSYGSAITHVQSGIKILHELQFNERNAILEASKIPYVPMDVLEELMMRLDLQVTQVSNSHPTN
jgi:hypothetical protein